jgi:FkbM family methyltransferase
MSDTWTFRPGTVDRSIFIGVARRNEYQLPDHFTSFDTIIDIGSHIGSFAYAAVERGCRHVYAFEADHENCRRAETHLRPYIDAGWVRLSHKAVWRSDANDDQLRFDGYQKFPASFEGMDGIVNTGNGSVLWGTGDQVAKIALDDVIDEITANGTSGTNGRNGANSENSANGAGRIRLLKLDCEGAEWPILLTSRRLHLVDEIVGEFHELGGEYLEIGENRPATPIVFRSNRVTSFTIDELARVLAEEGFEVTHRRHRRPDGTLEGLGMFFARRPPAA